MAQAKKTKDRRSTSARPAPGLPSAVAAGQAARAGTTAAGRAVAAAAAAGKTPLIVTGAALTGIVGGLALRSRS